MTWEGSLISELPEEVLIDNLLPALRVADLLRLASTNKTFARICSDDTFWKRRLQSDFNFTGEGTARTSGWKFIYRNFADPKVFVWGDKNNGRLGLSKFPKSVVHGVTYPIQLNLPNARIVSLVAGGMSFHGLDSEGVIHVWGTLDGSTMALQSEGFSEPGKPALTPHILKLPSPVRSISCGRLHSMALDNQNRIWTFVNWGRPFHLSSPLLLGPASVPRQTECGWNFSSFLSKSGDVFVWWPSSGRMGETVTQKNHEMDQDNRNKAHATTDNVIPCIIWELQMNPVQLPPLPLLPEIHETDEETILIQIAGFDCHLIGLTNKGHVLKFGCLGDEATVHEGRWEYLPEFSEVKRVRNHPTFSASESSLPLPESLKITHVTANYLHFVAYSTDSGSIVLIGDCDTGAGSIPKVIPELQYKSVISVVLGDYHSLALTSNGKVLSWGACSNGALGLGDPLKLQPGSPGAYRTEQQRLRAENGGWVNPSDVAAPTEIRFDHGRKKPKDRYCFSITAAGWHSGALAIDLEPDSEPDDDKVEFEEAAVRSNVRSDHSWESPPIIPQTQGGGMGIFRIGLAGRGRGGRGRGV